MMASLAEVFQWYNRKLVTSLPMKDVVFVAELNTKGLFSGGLKADVKAKPTAPEAADYFLDNKIEKDLINGNDNSFQQLLSVMEEYNESLKVLATEIKEKLKANVPPVVSSHEQPTNGAGMYIVTFGEKFARVSLIIHFCTIIKTHANVSCGPIIWGMCKQHEYIDTKNNV